MDELRPFEAPAPLGSAPAPTPLAAAGLQTEEPIQVRTPEAPVQTPEEMGLAVDPPKTEVVDRIARAGRVSPFEDELDVPTFLRRRRRDEKLDDEGDRDEPAFLRRSAD